jgi:RHS repeat-associated protein
MQSKNRRTYGPSGGSSSSVFTAFGEPRSATLDGGDNRYGYVGAHGYQAHDEMPFLHVGHRYYDPSIGRFLQRDFIGIRGGWNVYGYVRGRATGRIDPSGLIDGNGGGDSVVFPLPGAPTPEGIAEDNYRRNTEPVDVQAELDQVKFEIKVLKFLICLASGAGGGFLAGGVTGAIGGGIAGGGGGIVAVLE